MSFFLYNQDGHQAIARPFLDDRPAMGKPGVSPLDDHSATPKYHELENFDARTDAPSSNFIYDFEYFRYMTRSNWTEVFAHDSKGDVTFGQLDDLVDAFDMACSLGPHDCIVLDVERAPASPALFESRNERMGQ